MLQIQPLVVRVVPNIGEPTQVIGAGFLFLPQWRALWESLMIIKSKELGYYIDNHLLGEIRDQLWGKVDSEIWYLLWNQETARHIKYFLEDELVSNGAGGNDETM